MIASDPSRCFTFVSVGAMKKYIVQCSTDASVKKAMSEIEKVQVACKAAHADDLPAAEQLAVEKKARKELQIQNVTLLNRIAELEGQLEAEVQRRKAAECKARANPSTR